MKFSEEQLKELVDLAKHAPQAYVRMKALAVWNVACGRSQSEVSKFMQVSRVSISEWLNAYHAQGIRGFLVKRGRGRKEKAIREEIEAYLKQRPERFGLKQARWTLRALAEKVPSLEGFTESGVYKALVRMGYRYKRGKLHVHRAEAAYAEERGLWGAFSTRQGAMQKGGGGAGLH